MADTKIAENGEVEKNAEPEISSFPKRMLKSDRQAFGWRVLPLLHLDDPVEFVTSLRKMDMRDDDVIIAAFPKSGTHWMWEVTKMLRKGIASYEDRSKETVMLEFSKRDVIEKEASPRTLNSHLPMCHLPQQVKEKKIKILHLVRNPKDVIVSYYYHLLQMGKFTMSELLELYLTNGMMMAHQFDFLRQMQQYQKDNPEVPVMTIYYEDMKENPVQIAQELAKFLGHDVTEKFCKEVVEACSFSKMKEADPQKKEPKHENTGWKGPPLKVYRKGQIGDWKNHLTVAQNEMIDDFIARESEGIEFQFKYI
ncbi:sulfotransferase family cytosolic 1B member 1-like [Aplysia californica]|uniref:Sulfotransferase family cytosolic 1B member 1-like n=1 Tax=Aplysia californica TaxID=6500 RepID=A0ABM0JE71_APLCA|nr:sulfotransferase family cytosolic 1B member 1-like [Aplysia californica]